MFDPVLFAQTMHGHVGVLAGVALVHPVITLRPGKLRPGTGWSVALAAGLSTLTFASGWLLYPGYRAGHKRVLLHEAYAQALVFETKEHLAFHMLVLTWTGFALVRFAAPHHRALARRAFAAAAAIALLNGALGAVVAAS